MTRQQQEPQRSPLARPGNQNARKHGGYSERVPATLAELVAAANAAMLAGELSRLEGIARAIRRRVAEVQPTDPSQAGQARAAQRAARQAAKHASREETETA